MVMEHLEGRDLEALLAERGRLPLEEAVEYLLQVCEGLADAHTRGVVHRDLKPANLFVTRRPDGSPLVKILDFGISRVEPDPAKDTLDTLTSTTTSMGSPAYMSPEQIRAAREVDARTDIWSLGVVLHKLLTGNLPFPAGGAMELLAKILTEEPDPLPTTALEIPSELGAVVRRCLEKDREKRFSDVGALAEALAPFAAEHRRSGAAERVRMILAAGDAERDPTDEILLAAPAAQPELPGEKTQPLAVRQQGADENA
jgi:serine/threonine-protein kinase